MIFWGQSVNGGCCTQPKVVRGDCPINNQVQSIFYAKKTMRTYSIAKYCWWTKSLHQLRLVAYPIIYRVFCKKSRWCAGFLNHQPYVSHSNPSGLTVRFCGLSMVIPGTLKAWTFQQSVGLWHDSNKSKGSESKNPCCIVRVHIWIYITT